MLTLEFKAAVYNACSTVLENKRLQLEESLALLKSDLQNESKSTAGDKHETGRAMLQLEMEKLGGQLQNVLKQGAIFKRIPFEKTFSQVASGSLVKLSSGLFFISLGLSTICVENQDIICLAPNAPLGQAMLGKTIGQTITFREQELEIRAIL